MKLVVENITVSRGEEVILQDLSFTQQSGKALIVRGANGAGKSTLLRTLAGLLPATHGHMHVEGAEAEFADLPLPQLCHHLSTDNAMKPTMTVEENLNFWRDFDGTPHLSADEALEMVGLDGLQSVPFTHLSTGQRRRIGICRLLVSYRPIWLLDEPVSGLDAASSQQFADLMAAHLEDEGMIIVATHVPLGLDEASVLTLGDEPVDIDESMAL